MPAVATQSGDPWGTPPERLTLIDRAVHLWRASLDLTPARLQGLAETLSEDERAGASRFRFERDRRRYVACRAVLRTILGRYLRVAPGSLKFRYSPHGKPAIANGPGANAIRFNVSHAESMALFGFSRGRELGIDLERVRSDFAIDEIADRFFSQNEVAALRALRPADRVLAFFRCWTRKEAYIKARGDGLSLPLAQFDVSLLPGEPAALLSTRHDPPDAARWSLEEPLAGPEFVAAIAVEGHGWQLQCWEWPAPGA